MQRIGICTAGVNAADHVHRADLAPDLHGFDPASGLDAQRVGRQPRDHSAYQRVTGAAFGVDSLVDDQPSDRLADLDPDRGIRVRGDLVELHRVDRRAGKVVEPVDVESTGADPVGLYRSLHVQCRDGAEVDEANTASTVRGERGGRGPVVDHTPVVEHHVVDAMCSDRPVVDHLTHVDAIDDEDTAADPVV